MMTLGKRLLATGLALAVSSACAAEPSFDRFTPIAGGVGAGALPEDAPYKLSSPCFHQTSIVVRDVSQARRFDGGRYDMQTTNESGPDAGRYLFSVFEAGQAGIQRTDLHTLTTTTLWAAPAPGSHVAFDSARWTPWGSFLTAEESWREAAGSAGRHGRLFEVTNPLAAPADIVIKHRGILPRVAHEGLAFDSRNNLYFVDEHRDGHVFRFTSARPNARNGDDYFAAGQTLVLRVGDGTVKDATGAATWIPLTDPLGGVLPGGVVVTDPRGAAALDGRATPTRPAFLGTRFDRPEDLEIKTLNNGRQTLFVATTTNHKVFSIDLSSGTVKLFASRDTSDLATGRRVGRAFTNPDNLAIDARGNLYIVEDQPGGVGDIWFARDDNHDGVAEGLGKWASLSTVGAESTGLYFDTLKPTIAYVNVQHPASGIDRTVMLSAACPQGNHDLDDHHGRDTD